MILNNIVTSDIYFLMFWHYHEQQLMCWYCACIFHVPPPRYDSSRLLEMHCTMIAALAKQYRWEHVKHAGMVGDLYWVFSECQRPVTTLLAVITLCATNKYYLLGWWCHSWWPGAGVRRRPDPRPARIHHRYLWGVFFDWNWRVFVHCCCKDRSAWRASFRGGPDQTLSQNLSPGAIREKWIRLVALGARVAMLKNGVFVCVSFCVSCTALRGCCNCKQNDASRWNHCFRGLRQLTRLACLLCGHKWHQVENCQICSIFVMWKCPDSESL